MENLHCFRRRRWPNVTEYSRLEDDSDHSQYSDSSASSAARRTRLRNRPALCDKCWNRRKRAVATKRCLECKKNLCSECARRDEIRRPWWLPNIIVQCWRYLFSSVFTPHPMVSLDDSDTNTASGQRQHQWMYSQEANHVQNIPRIKRSSLTSMNSRSSSKSRNSDKHSENAMRNPEGEYIQRIRSNSADNRRGKKYSRSKSTEEHNNIQKLSRVRRDHGRRSRSADRSKRDITLEGEQNRLRQYSANWENEQLEMSEDRAFTKKLRGKDVTIEITSNEFKISVDKSNKKDISKSKSKRQPPSKKMKQNEKYYKPYTEESFDEVPIWFKKNDSLESKTSNKSAKGQRPYKQPSAENVKQPTKVYANTSNTDPSTFPTDDRTPYIVEEPPDLCPICLDELPESESRRLSCSHLIHTKCLIEYLQGTDLDFGIPCPLCSRVTVIYNYYAARNVWYNELPVSTSV